MALIRVGSVAVTVPSKLETIFTRSCKCVVSINQSARVTVGTFSTVLCTHVILFGGWAVHRSTASTVTLPHGARINGGHKTRQKVVVFSFVLAIAA